MKSNQEIVNDLLSNGLKQQELADFLGITRQSVKRCAEGYELSSKLDKFDLLRPLSIENQMKMVRIDRYYHEMLISFSKKPFAIDKVEQGFSYIHHWCTDPKYPEPFVGYLFGHVVNFYTRYSPYTLLIRDFFNIEDRSVLTMSIDYDNYRIKSYSLGTVKNHVEGEPCAYVLLNDPITFEDFVERLYSTLGSRVRISIYGDNQDDEFDFIRDNLKKSHVSQFNNISVFDFSRMFNYFETKSKIGPQLEVVLKNFNIEYNLKKLLKDCGYRAGKIIDLVNMVALSSIREQNKMPNDVIFDGSSKNTETHYMVDKRRELKR
jgi:hypothetical protein